MFSAASALYMHRHKHSTLTAFHIVAHRTLIIYSTHATHTRAKQYWHNRDGKYRGQHNKICTQQDRTYFIYFNRYKKYREEKIYNLLPSQSLDGIWVRVFFSLNSLHCDSLNNVIKHFSVTAATMWHIVAKSFCVINTSWLKF